jgi:hypothetical protein
MMVLRISSASVSDVILGVFLVLAYAGDNNAFTADLPDGHNAVLQGCTGGRYGRGERERDEKGPLTFEIVNPFAIQDPDPVLEPRFTTAEKIHDVTYLLRCLLLLLGGRHGPWRIDYVTEELAPRPHAWRELCSRTTRMQL